MSLDRYYDLIRRLAAGDDVDLSDLSTSQRALLAARLADRPVGRWSSDVPTFDDWATRIGVGTSTIGIAKRVLGRGSRGLIELIWVGKVTVNTADRVVGELSAESQAEFVARVRDGWDARRLAPAAHQGPRRGKATAATRVSLKGAQHAPMIEQMTRTATAWADHTYADIDALDDSVTPDLARVLAPDLTRALRTLNRVNRLLRKRAYEHDSSSSSDKRYG